ncbi:rta1 domain-containing protein [Fusarium flagelliforme]|uniref:Rta1 domain-containing protein n=1 Tax=Fusarium flagelliforme TaxID=2675880 RepID=A0A395MKJ3_9HYPO|nr:rta1 domain-containing protein [Fusarium flagelliforme]
MTEFKLYHYDPSFIAAIIFVALFATSTLGHVYQLVRFRAFFFIPFVIGCIFEVIGYVGRVISAKQSPDWTIMPYVLQSLLLLLGPTMLAASIYMSLGRLVVFLDAGHYSLIPVEYLTKTFVIGDVLSFLAQSGGGGMLANAKSSGDQKMGQNIIIVGLAIQIYFFAFFITVLHIVHRRLLANPTRRSLSFTTEWKRLILVLYVASGFIMVRSIFRMVEYITGTNGPLQSTEVYIYVFDASLICITTFLFNVFHPGRMILAGKDRMEILDTDDQSTSIPLRYSGQTAHTVTQPLPSPPIQKHHSGEVYSAAHYGHRSRTQSPPARYHRQPCGPSSPSHYHPQAHRSLSATLNSTPYADNEATAYNSYSGEYEALSRNEGHTR